MFLVSVKNRFWRERMPKLLTLIVLATGGLTGQLTLLKSLDLIQNVQ